MQAKTLPVLSSTITCHAWSRDKSFIAVCPNSNEIHIYATNGSVDNYDKWTLEHTMTEHDHHVTCIDWAPQTNRILSCSQDRNAYVWNFDENEKIWRPTLVLLRINRAATCCKWSPRENKFAVGSGAKMVSVCYFEEDNNWWVSKMIKKPHKSTILQLNWHPTDNTLLTTASSDFKARVFSAWVRDADDKDKKRPFGQCLHEYTAKGWVHDSIYSPKGSTLAFLGHDSSVSFVSTENEVVQTVRSPDLPFMSGLFISENAFIAVGYDYSPIAFSKDPRSKQWVLHGKVDTGDNKTEQETGIKNAFLKFQAQSRIGSQNADNLSTALRTRHTNVINSIKPFKVSDGVVVEFSTSGLDGRVLIWSLEDVTTKFPTFAY